MPINEPMKTRVYTLRELRFLLLAAGEDLADFDAGVPQIIDLDGSTHWLERPATESSLSMADRLQECLARFPKYARLVFVSKDLPFAKQAADKAYALGFANAAALDA